MHGWNATIDWWVDKHTNQVIIVVEVYGVNILLKDYNMHQYSRKQARILLYNLKHECE